MLVAILALAGCGGQPFPTSAARKTPTTKGKVAAPQNAPTPKARLLAAMQHTTAERTARIAMHMSFDVGPDNALTLDGSGLIDLANQKLDLTATTKSSAPDADDQTLELRIVNRVAYTNENGDGQWTSAPFDGEAQTSAVPDPTSYADYLQGISDNVRVDGHEPLRGVDTTRYMATVDLGHALSRTAKTPAQKSLMQNAVSLFGNLQIPVTAWVDGAGRLRKLNLTMNLSTATGKQFGAGAGVQAKIGITMEFYDFGVPVAVTVPPGAISARIADADHAAQADLRDALTAEKTLYTDNQTYSTDAATMGQIEPSLGWGTKLSVAIADADGEPGQVVCLSERSASGTTFAIADVATGLVAGTYYAKTACPAVVSEQSASVMATSW